MARMLGTTDKWPPGAIELTQDESTYALGLTPILILQANPDRIAFIAQNLGGGSVYLSLSPDVSANKGLKLTTDSNPLIISDSKLPGLASRAWYAVGAAVGQSIEVINVRYT